MDALRLVLYGQRAQCSTRNNLLAYADFLNQCRNRHANGTPTQLELSFLLTRNNAAQPTTLRVCRTWQSLGKKDRDTLKVFENELPLMLIRPLLKKAQPQAQDEIKHQQFGPAKDLIDDQNQAVMAFACGDWPMPLDDSSLWPLIRPWDG